MKTCLLTLLLTLSTSAFAQCAPEDIKINVLPFEVTHNYDKSLRELGQTFRYDLVGAVVTAYTYKVDGCVATVGYENPVLYIAKEVRRNACAFKHVLEHEEEHVRIYREALETLEARVRESAKAMSLKEAARREVDAVVPLHRHHDRPEEYDRNRTECRGAIAKLFLSSQ